MTLLMRPAEWLLDREWPLPAFLLLVAPTALAQVLLWALVMVPVAAAVCAPWVGLSYLIWWLT